MMTAAEEPLVVVAAIIRRGKRVLACRRRPERAAGGRWEFPGGKVEADETAEAALVRDIREELGVGIRVLSVLTIDDTRVGDRIIRLTCLEAELTDAVPTASTDHDLMRWVAVDELGALDWAEPDLPAVALLARDGRSRATPAR